MDDCTVKVDHSLCTGCGMCVRVCPKELLVVDRGKAQVRAGRCMACAHCVAACPSEAVTVDGLASRLGEFETFASSDQWLPHGGMEPGEVVRLMRSRRSCRNFAPEPVGPALLRDLVRAGVSAPSGTNSQCWTFTIVPDREGVRALGERIGVFFRKLNRLAANPLLREGLALAGKPGLKRYHQRHIHSVREALRRWDQEGVDLLFHGCAALIVVGSRPGASCPAEDALLATQNILLAAHALGLGTCLIGYAVEALRRDRSTARAIAIPDEEAIHSVIALGHPAESYERVAPRKSCVIRFSGE